MTDGDGQSIESLIQMVDMKGKSLYSITQLDPRKIFALFSLGEKLRKVPANILKKKLLGKTVSVLFFQESTRTRNSFASAIKSAF
jgi:aspartate carbamoyltransferase catalytic subunit